MNDHHHVQKNLPLYVSGDLDDTTQTQMTAHLAQCSDCRTACQQQRALLGMLSAESVGETRKPMSILGRSVVTAAAAAVVFVAGYLTASQSDDVRQAPEHRSSRPSRAYDRYVASHSMTSGMFRALAAVTRVEEHR